MSADHGDAAPFCRVSDDECLASGCPPCRYPREQCICGHARDAGLRKWLRSDEAVTIAAGALSANYLTAPSSLPDEFGQSAVTTNQATAKAGATRVIRALLAAEGGPS